MASRAGAKQERDHTYRRRRSNTRFVITVRKLPARSNRGRGRRDWKVDIKVVTALHYSKYYMCSNFLDIPIHR